MDSIKALAKTTLHLWIDLVERARVLIVILAIITTVFALNYIKNNLGMNTDTRDMLSQELGWRKLDLEYERQFPHTADNILLVIEADTPDQAINAAALLHQELTKTSNIFRNIYYPQGLPLFRENALLFLDIDELQDLADNLAAIQPFLARLTEDQTIRGLFSMLSDAIDAIEDGDEIDITPLLTQVNQSLNAALKKQPYIVSWHQLMNNNDEKKAIYREFIVLQPKLDYSGLLPAAPAIEKLHQISEELKLQERLGARMRLTGSAVLSHEELLSISRGTEISITLAFLTVAIIMIFGIGSFRLVIMSLITLVFGLILTAAFATFAVGELNLISIAFAILYIGLGVDFAIHYCLRYREFRIAGHDNLKAIWESSASTGGSLFLCAVTTAIGFYVFIPTDYDGVAELGLISGTGMFISLFVTLTLLPALLGIVPYKKFKQRPGKSPPAWLTRLQEFPITHSRVIMISSLLLSLLLLSLLTQVRFDHNTLNLQAPENESVKTLQDLLVDKDINPWSGIVLTEGRENAQHLKHKLNDLALVKDVIWLEDFIPEDQEEKLSIVEEMDLLLGGALPDEPMKPAISTQEQETILISMAKNLEGLQLINELPALLIFKQSINAYLEHIVSKDQRSKKTALNKLEHSLVSTLPGRLEALRISLYADYVAEEDLPVELVKRWRSPQGSYLLELQSEENLVNNVAMRHFVDQIQQAEPNVIGSSVVSIEASDVVVGAFKQAFTYSFIAILVLLLILLKHKRDTAYIMAPLIMAAICTGSASVLLDIPFNFANIIALPLILGIGVDSGIHIQHRFRSDLANSKNILATSSARAVLVSSLTTMGSIGNLAFSPHLGTASMGKILTIGIFMTLICTLVVLPSILATQIKRK